MMGNPTAVWSSNPEAPNFEQDSDPGRALDRLATACRLQNGQLIVGYTVEPNTGVVASVTLATVVNACRIHSK